MPAAYSSQECHRCGSREPGQRENQASSACKNPACGWAGNADYNASIVIEQRAFGLRPTALPRTAVGEGAKLISDVGLTPAACTGHKPVTPASNTGAVTEALPLGGPRMQEQDTVSGAAA